MFSFYCSVAHRDLHSFPTRRSSDLLADGCSYGRHGVPSSVGRRARVSVIFDPEHFAVVSRCITAVKPGARLRSEEHTSELQSRQYLVCRLLLEKKKNNTHKLVNSNN